MSAAVSVSDFRHPGTLLDATHARFVDLGEGRAPMASDAGWRPSQRRATPPRSA